MQWFHSSVFSRKIRGAWSRAEERIQCPASETHRGKSSLAFVYACQELHKQFVTKPTTFVVCNSTCIEKTRQSRAKEECREEKLVLFIFIYSSAEVVECLNTESFVLYFFALFTHAIKMCFPRSDHRRTRTRSETFELVHFWPLQKYVFFSVA